MTHKTGWVHQLKWGNPYTKPPNNLPVILATWTDKEPTFDDFKAIYPDYRLGCGFGSHIQFPSVERKPLSKETKERMQIRRKKTQEANWLRKNMPLLAEQIISDKKLDWRAFND